MRDLYLSFLSLLYNYFFVLNLLIARKTVNNSIFFFLFFHDFFIIICNLPINTKHQRPITIQLNNL